MYGLSDYFSNNRKALGCAAGEITPAMSAGCVGEADVRPTRQSDGGDERLAGAGAVEHFADAGGFAGGMEIADANADG